MQKVSIKNARVAVHYALFLGRRGAIVNYLTCFENKAVLEIDMYPYKLPARCDTTSPEEVGEKCRRRDKWFIKKTDGKTKKYWKN